MLRIQSILYPTDFSSYSNQAYLYAVALAETHRATLTVVYVAHGEQPGGVDHWRGQLEQIRPANPTIPVHHVFLEGEPATEIVRYARDASFDLIVMGTHGRTGVERMLMGSVTEKVLGEAPCSVLVVKLPRTVARAVRSDAPVVANK